MDMLAQCLLRLRTQAVAMMRARVRSAQEEARVAELHTEMVQAFVKEDPEHVALMRALWERTCVAEETGEEFSLEGADGWRLMGFQNRKVTSDLRGSAVLTLKGLNYFLAEHPDWALPMLERRRRSREERRARGDESANFEHYPWAVAAFSVTQMIAKAFGFFSMSPMLTTGSGAGSGSKATYWHLLMDGQSAVHIFQKLFALGFVCLDAKWREMNATYLQFPHVLREAETQFNEVLATGQHASLVAFTETVANLAGVAVPPAPEAWNQLPTGSDDEMTHSSEEEVEDDDEEGERDFYVAREHTRVCESEQTISSVGATATTNKCLGAVSADLSQVVRHRTHTAAGTSVSIPVPDYLTGDDGDASEHDIHDAAITPTPAFTMTVPRAYDPCQHPGTAAFLSRQLNTMSTDDRGSLLLADVMVL